MTKAASTRKPDDISLRITRVFDAPRDLVYRMWTEKHLMDRWSCPDDFTISGSGAELKVGGTWHATMRASNGSELKLSGAYREIVPNERLVFTHAWLDEDGTPGVIRNLRQHDRQ